MSLRPFLSREIQVGDLRLGGLNPIVIQSMTTSDTMNIEATVAQVRDLARAGCQIVRITAPTVQDAEALKDIRDRLRAEGIGVPLVADIHFVPAAAMAAADYVEKVRINPGNFSDRKMFKVREYSDSEYQEELDRIHEKFKPLVLKLKSLGRALRIGTNHGSLSDRIMNRYGDSPEGMVESAFEFAEICRLYDFHNFCFSMKASNVAVMVKAYRLLVDRQLEKGWDYPLHLGVTEAGDGEDGRVKSALGIGMLLAEGLGDTIRVSLTEAAVKEIPVARALAEAFPRGKILEPKRRIEGPAYQGLPEVWARVKDLEDLKRSLAESRGGSEFLPDVLAFAVSEDFLSEVHTLRIRVHALWPKAPLPRLAALVGDEISARDLKRLRSNVDLLVSEGALDESLLSSPIAVVRLTSPEDLCHPAAEIVLLEEGPQAVGDLRRMLRLVARSGRACVDSNVRGLCVEAGSWSENLRLSFAILQAARRRMSKTEYISCPSCGRTLFDLEETTARIKAHTAHLVGVKIAVMGCIVNGPGEMADADFGYVGGAPGRVNLYVGKDCVERNIESLEAPQRLVELIKRHNRWQEPLKESNPTLGP